MLRCSRRVGEEACGGIRSRRKVIRGCFFFQAEDGIRDLTVTGVQTCALPISSGTMNNLTIGGLDPRTGEPFAYYETIAGGMGARPSKPGVSGVHTHMTNSLNTPAEALEYAYPLRVRRYSLRQGSGGSGKYRGGDGIVREIELLSDAEVTLLADRRTRGPYGLNGGGDGGRGKGGVIRGDGAPQRWPGKFKVRCVK